MNANKTFALIDNCSGFVWWVGAAATPEEACAAATLETGGDAQSYEAAHQLASNEGGYHVYEAPSGFDVNDGQDQNEIDAVSTMPLVGKFRQAPAKLGRPVEMDGGKRVNVYLDAASLARAAELGGGNVSEGIRAALKVQA